MKRDWKPLDVGGMRLYRVQVSFPGKPQWNSSHVVAADSPSQAAKLYEQCLKGAAWEVEPIITGHALNILMPADWWERGAPDGYCEKCCRWSLRVVNNDLICANDDAHSLKTK